MEIRDATLQDTPAVRPLLRQMGYTDDELGDVEQRLPTMLATDGVRLLVAVEGGAVVGLASVVTSQSIEQPAPSCRLSVIVVDDDRRREGIGRALMAACESAARDAGCYRIELTTLSDNTGAHALYHEAGYENTGFRFKRML